LDDVFHQLPGTAVAGFLCYHCRKSVLAELAGQILTRTEEKGQRRSIAIKSIATHAHIHWAGGGFLRYFLPGTAPTSEI
jgi:hypothetical protein